MPPSIVCKVGDGWNMVDPKLLYLGHGSSTWWTVTVCWQDSQFVRAFSVMRDKWVNAEWPMRRRVSVISCRMFSLKEVVTLPLCRRPYFNIDCTSIAELEIFYEQAFTECYPDLEDVYQQKWHTYIIIYARFPNYSSISVPMRMRIVLEVLERQKLLKYGRDW